ncbi:MAG: pilus assembly protein PilP [Proteobacteria bacterium]|nr:pilus assembly protein PilP [Pseudomonadota bacterium]
MPARIILLSILLSIMFCGYVYPKVEQKMKQSGDILLEDVGTKKGERISTSDSIVNSISRDPFYRVLDQLGWDNTSITDYELNDLELIGVIWDVPKPVAMFKAPKERRFIVKVGDKIGKNNGIVMHIGKGETGIRETYMDINGAKTEKSTIKRVDNGLNGGLNE